MYGLSPSGDPSLGDIIDAARRSAAVRIDNVPAGSTVTQLSGPPWVQGGFSENGQFALVWAGNADGGEPVEFRLTAPDGSTKYGHATLIQQGVVPLSFPSDFSSFSSTQKWAIGIGVVATAGLAFKFWPKRK